MALIQDQWDDKGVDLYITEFVKLTDLSVEWALSVTRVCRLLLTVRRCVYMY